MQFSVDFLNNIEIEEVKNVLPKKRITNSKNLNPPSDTLYLRVWYNGGIYPSEKLISQFNLEFVPTVDNEYTTSPGNGFDVFDMSEWTQISDKDRENKLVLVGVTPKDKGRVELFASVKRSKEGIPVKSIKDYGATVYSKTVFLPMLEKIYGITLEKGAYVDLEVLISYNQRSKVRNGLFVLPKKVKRGEKSGAPAVEVRENIDIYPLVPVVTGVIMDETIPKDISTPDNEETIDS